MIAVNRYREFMVELANRVAQAYNDAHLEEREERFQHVVAAMTEGQLITLLSDKAGLVMCGNVPGAELTRNGYVESEAQCLLLILEKSPKDRQGTDWEFQRYQLTQELMSKLCEILMGQDAFALLCESGKMAVDRLNVEPEYNIYGGFNGWSVTFKLPDGKGTGIY
ncbi:MAG: hypothetical protein IKI19_03520 [Prevotella sp.]|nr:hypothetical protein [Prevotella sp.]